MVPQQPLDRDPEACHTFRVRFEVLQVQLLRRRREHFFDQEQPRVQRLEEPDAPLLTREITTFRLVGAAYRRASETHRVRLYTREEIESELRQAGFSVRVQRRYGTQEVGPQRLVFCARKI